LRFLFITWVGEREIGVDVVLRRVVFGERELLV
jgi:hypothetical protein